MVRLLRKCNDHYTSEKMQLCDHVLTTLQRKIKLWFSNDYTTEKNWYYQEIMMPLRKFVNNKTKKLFTQTEDLSMKLTILYTEKSSTIYSRNCYTTEKMYTNTVLHH